MEEWVASLSDAAAKLLLVLVLREGQWPSTQVLMRLTGLSDKTIYRARKELLTPEGVSFSEEIFTRTAKKFPHTEEVSCPTEEASSTTEKSSARPRLLRNEDDTPQFSGVEEGEEFVQGFYGGRRPKTAEDEAAMQRMERIQAAIIAKKGAIRWGN